MTLAVHGGLATRAARYAAALPAELAARFSDAVPHAAAVVTARLRGAAHREGLARAEGRRHGFNRVEVEVPAGTDPTGALPGVLTGGVAAELLDATVNLALAYARRPVPPADALTAAAALPPDDGALLLEQLSTDGHNLHPCGRTRLGMDVADLLAHDLETAGTEVAWVAVRRDRLTGGGIDPTGGEYALHPVHAWQLDRVVRVRYAGAIAAGIVVPVPGARTPAAPTSSLRTVLLPPDPHGRRRYLKLSLDIQVTSTRRGISVASTVNGPRISALLTRLAQTEPALRRVVFLPELAGAAVTFTEADRERERTRTQDPDGDERNQDHQDRDLAAIVRGGLAGRVSPGELAVPGNALYATCPHTGRTVLSLLLDRYAATRGAGDPALGFVGEYADLLLPPVLHLADRYGIGLEAHLQNSVPTFVGGVPHRLVVRDFAGMRVHLPTLRAAGASLDLWPGSVIAAGDPGTVRAKVAYTALQANLGEIVTRLVHSHGLDEQAAWARIRRTVDRACAGDLHEWLTAPTLPHKALLSMRLSGRPGDIYVPVENALAA